MAQLLLTDWLTICTAGPTVDGRTIEEKWLTEAAKNYDREEYPAFVNCEHYYGNLGTVWELRTERDKKSRLCLQARIRVNKYFLQQNAEGSASATPRSFCTISRKPVKPIWSDWPRRTPRPASAPPKPISNDGKRISFARMRSNLRKSNCPGMTIPDFMKP
ncbi:MAG: GPO family capsid scaffolding protein [Lentisphaeria bacterium]|nr:MAG: GPO family capsid scaffolding protein [Lentisphaeria bacterium]